MALYDGFFDAAQNEETGEYDRTYGADDFTDYFAHVVGSGVCVHNNPDSFLVRLEDGQAVVSPGYLFINGYWLKNDADYPVTLPGSGNYAIVARLNLGSRMIELGARTVEASYTDSLVLSIVSPSFAEDTRYNTDICGVIDTAGELNSKVQWALNYIDTEIESKLEKVEQELYSQSAKLDEKIEEAKAETEKLKPSPVGTIKFTAETNVAANWMRCDGSTVSKTEYPALVAALQELQGGSGNTARLPNLSTGGVPGYIKAFTDDDMIDIDVLIEYYNSLAEFPGASPVLSFHILFNDEPLTIEQTYIRSVPKNGNFKVGIKYHTQVGGGRWYVLQLNGADVVRLASTDPVGMTASATFKTSDFRNGIKLVLST